MKDVEPKMNYVGESRMADKPKCLAGNSLREKAKRTDTIRGRIMSVSVGSLGRIFAAVGEPHRVGVRVFVRLAFRGLGVLLEDFRPC